MIHAKHAIQYFQRYRFDADIFGGSIACPVAQRDHQQLRWWSGNYQGKSASIFEQPGLERYSFALSRAILDRSIEQGAKQRCHVSNPCFYRPY